VLPGKFPVSSGWLPLKRVRRTGRLPASPPIVLAGGFIVLIALGTLLLLLPFASREPVSVLSALFMATSAVTVTGLTVLDVGAHLTGFGQIVLLLLVQIGGLGFVTLAVVAVLALGRRISLRQQGIILEAFNQTSVASIRKTAFAVFRLAFLIELLAIVVLFLYWLPSAGWGQALYRAFFHSIMAFNNSGFELHGTALAQYVDAPIPILVTTALIILGGVGVFVLQDIQEKWRWKRLTVYTRSIIIATISLNVLGFLLIWLFEHNNSATLGELSVKGQALAAWLQSVTARTAGFTSIDVSQLHDSSTLIMLLYMFIGGGSLSTASGIKVGTFVVLVFAAIAFLRGRSEVVLFKRSIAPQTVQKALALLLLTSGIAFIGILLIVILEDKPFLSLVFEVVSALSTTGMTRNLTPELGGPAQVLLMVLMFVGRLGPLTFIYSLSTQKQSLVAYPQTPYHVG